MSKNAKILEEKEPKKIESDLKVTKIKSYVSEKTKDISNQKNSAKKNKLSSALRYNLQRRKVVLKNEET